MLVIMNGAEEIKELLYEAKQRACYGLELKKDYPQLASYYIELANNGLMQAEKLHNYLVDIIDKYKTTSTAPDSMKELWNHEHRNYVEMYEKVKIKIAMYNKM